MTIETTTLSSGADLTVCAAIAKIIDPSLSGGVEILKVPRAAKRNAAGDEFNVR